MEWLVDLFTGSGVAHSVFVLAVAMVLLACASRLAQQALKVIKKEIAPINLKNINQRHFLQIPHHLGNVPVVGLAV